MGQLDSIEETVPEGILAILSATGAEVRWQANFTFSAKAGRPGIVRGSTEKHPTAGGVERAYRVNFRSDGEGIGTAIGLVTDEVRTWPIRCMRFGATEIRPPAPKGDPGIKEAEVELLRKALEDWLSRCLPAQTAIGA